MQDCYAFDVGDFGKLGLLRHLSSGTGLRLGVIWYLNDRLSKAADGKHLAYLDLGREQPAPRRARYSACDPELYEGFRAALQVGGELAAHRSVARLELSGLLPAGTAYFNDLMASVPRPTWFSKACAAVAGCDLVFADPDNGIEGLTRPAAPPTPVLASDKHMSLAEVEYLYGHGQSLVLYHQLCRHGSYGSHESQIERGLARVRDAVKPAASWAVRFRRGSSRAFYVVGRPEHAELLGTRLAALAASSWLTNRHMEVIR